MINNILALISDKMKKSKEENLEGVKGWIYKESGRGKLHLVANNM